MIRRRVEEAKREPSFKRPGARVQYNYTDGPVPPGTLGTIIGFLPRSYQAQIRWDDESVSNHTPDEYDVISRGAKVAEARRRPTDPHNLKSHGHIGFDGDWEYFEVDGEVYRAPRNAPLADISGPKPRRHGRWESSRPHFDRFRQHIAPGLKAPTRAPRNHSTGQFTRRGR